MPGQALSFENCPELPIRDRQHVANQACGSVNLLVLPAITIESVEAGGRPGPDKALWINADGRIDFVGQTVLDLENLEIRRRQIGDVQRCCGCCPIRQSDSQQHKTVPKCLSLAQLWYVEDSH